MNGSFCPVCSAVKTPWSDSFCTQKQQTGIVCVRCQKHKNVSCLLNAHSFLRATLCSFWLHTYIYIFFFYYSCKTVSIDLQSSIASSECFVLYSSTSVDVCFWPVGWQRCEGCVCLLLLSRNLWIRALCLIVPYSNNTVESYKVLIDSAHYVKPNQITKDLARFFFLFFFYKLPWSTSTWPLFKGSLPRFSWRETANVLWVP